MLSDTDIEDIRQTLSKLAEQEDCLTLQRLPTGAIRLRLISPEFEGLDDYGRYELVNSVLQPLGCSLGSLEIPSYILMTPEESTKYPTDFPAPLPTWSEVLSAPIPDKQDESREQPAAKPFIATFYSFKGGVGRSTSLAIVGNMLARRGRRVVLIDFDLEAPGLTSSVIKSNDGQLTWGVLDYVYQRWILPSASSPSLAECIQQVGDGSYPLFLVPAGRYDENYIHKLADFEVAKYYRRDPNPIRLLIDEIKQQSNPDVILIDARTGFDNIGAVTLLDLAHLGIICFSPNHQSRRGLTWVLQAANKQRDIQGYPILRFVLSPMPTTTSDDRKKRLAQVEDWINKDWRQSDSSTPLDEMYTTINYNPAIAIMEDWFAELPESIIVEYQPIADWIDASLPDIFPASNGDVHQLALDELDFQTITAEQIQAERIPEIFQRTEDFPIFISNAISLIRGAKGTGKSLLFRLFVEQPSQARQLAQPHADLSDVEFVGAHGRRTLGSSTLSSQGFANLEERAGADMWRSFWPAYAVLRLTKHFPGMGSTVDTLIGGSPKLPDISQENLTEEALVDWLSPMLSSNALRLKVNDILRDLNRQLKQAGKRVWLFYDELDTSFGHTPADYERRRRALEGLLSWWSEKSDSFDQMQMKCLLREDIWRELNFSNKTHYAAKQMQLKWREEDLWRLVLRQALNSQAFSKYVADMNITRQTLEQLEVERLRKALFILWGERMGPSNLAYTYRWVLRHISDGQENRFPRSLMLLLDNAIKREKKVDSASSGALIGPRSLEKAMFTVSNNRVAEIREVFPELRLAFDALLNQTSPIDKSKLVQLFSGMNEKPDEVINQLLQVGVLEKRKSPLSEDDRYAVAELYWPGLGMGRKGPR